MKKTFFILCLVCSISCEQNVEIIEVPIPKGYPPIVKFTQERYDNFIQQWRKFTQAYNFDFYVPWFDSNLMIPEFPSVYLLNTPSDSLTLDSARTLLLTFIDEWHALLNASQSELTETEAWYNYWLKEYYFEYRKKFPGNFDASGLNMIIARVTIEGQLAFIISNCAPTVNVPTLVRIDSLKAKYKLLGKKMFYFDSAGRKEFTLTMNNLYESEITDIILGGYSTTSSGLLPLEYRHTWKIRTNIYYLYVDAITGEDLNYSVPYTFPQN